MTFRHFLSEQDTRVSCSGNKDLLHHVPQPAVDTDQMYFRKATDKSEKTALMYIL